MGLKSWLKQNLFIETYPEFSQPIDQKIYSFLDRPKTSAEIRKEFELSRSRASKRMLKLMADGLIKRDGLVFVRTNGKFGLKLNPRVWINTLAGVGLTISLPLHNPPLTLFSFVLLGVNVLSR